MRNGRAVDIIDDDIAHIETESVHVPGERDGGVEDIIDDIHGARRKSKYTIVPRERDGGAGDIIDDDVDGSELTGWGGTGIRSCVTEIGMIDAEIMLKINVQIYNQIRNNII